MFLTVHACSYCRRESSWCLAAGYGDQLKTDRPETVWICAWCVADARLPAHQQPKGARCATCGWRTIGKREVIIHTSSASWIPTRWRHAVQVVRARAVLVRGSRVACNYCIEDARTVLSSPWIRAARARWPAADILGDGGFAVIGCGERWIHLWRDRLVAEQAAVQADRVICGLSCPGKHDIEELTDERSKAAIPD